MTEQSETVALPKEDLFCVLARLFWLIEDINPLADMMEIVMDEDSSGKFADDEMFHEETPEDMGLISPPIFHQVFRAAQDVHEMQIANEYIELFAILSVPLKAEPRLKKEFEAYVAEKYGMEINILPGRDSGEKKKPRLALVRPDPPEVPPDPPETPPKK